MSKMCCAKQLALCVALVALAAWITGCQPEQPEAAPGASDAAASGGDDTDAKIQEAFAALSPEDRELAMKQKVCPVSDDVLGVMGTPIKVSVNGHDVFICCPSCEEPLMKDPDKYLVKLGLK